MGALYFLLHPNQLRAIIQWKVWHDPVHKRNPESESATLRSCFSMLTLTSRSFASVIQELNPELLAPVCLFYLVLRALDTIEDDMTLDIKVKEPLLRGFHEKMEIDGWTFHDNGPDEKDRHLLVSFADVIVELKKIKPAYYAIIRDVTVKMGNGMADYAVNAEHNLNGVDTVKDYELYCHYVAGLVGEGLTRLFVESELANPRLGWRMELTESMGQFLQKTNIIRDVHEDWLDRRRFWPRQIWSKYVDRWDDLFDPARRDVALHCSSEMVLNALKHAEHCIFYIAAIRDQSVFNFVAIPQTMAIATLELVFRNPAIFESHIKITKGDACQLMIDSSQDLRVVCDVFRKYTRRIHKKNDPRDPHYLAISLQCARIEQFIETIYPQQNPEKAREAIAQKQHNAANMSLTEVAALVGLVILSIALLCGLMIGATILMGRTFDNLWKTDSVYWPSDPRNPNYEGARDEL